MESKKLPLMDKYPSSFYQPLFDLMKDQHGLILLSSEMSDIIEMVRRLDQSQPGARWVKANISEIDKARFWTKVTVTDYCWEWAANRCQDGYGMFKLNGKDVKASRVAYAIVNGEIPSDLHVLHKCDNPCQKGFK